MIIILKKLNKLSIKKGLFRYKYKKFSIFTEKINPSMNSLVFILIRYYLINRTSREDIAEAAPILENLDSEISSSLADLTITILGRF